MLLCFTAGIYWVKSFNLVVKCSLFHLEGPGSYLSRGEEVEFFRCFLLPVIPITPEDLKETTCDLYRGVVILITGTINRLRRVNN